MSFRGKLITSECAAVGKAQHSAPCSDCPFRRDSLPGWLGGTEPEDYLAFALGDGRISCHTLKQQGAGKRGAGLMGFWQCAGAAIFRGNICKSPRDETVLRLGHNVSKVFASLGEFLRHHGSGPKVSD